MDLAFRVLIYQFQAIFQQKTTFNQIETELPVTTGTYQQMQSNKCQSNIAVTMVNIKLTINHAVVYNFRYTCTLYNAQTCSDNCTKPQGAW